MEGGAMIWSRCDRWDLVGYCAGRCDTHAVGRSRREAWADSLERGEVGAATILFGMAPC